MPNLQGFGIWWAADFLVTFLSLLFLGNFCARACSRARAEEEHDMAAASSFEFYQTPVAHYKFPGLPFSSTYLEKVPNLLNRPVRYVTLGVPKSYSIGAPILETLPDYVPSKNTLHIPIPPCSAGAVEEGLPRRPRGGPASKASRRGLPSERPSLPWLPRARVVMAW